MPLSPSIKVIRLLQEAVFMNAGSYVIRPKSSEETLIFRRSVARIAPSSIGKSYFLPVRLSSIVSVLSLISSPYLQLEAVLSERACTGSSVESTLPEQSGPASHPVWRPERRRPPRPGAPQPARPVGKGGGRL